METKNKLSTSDIPESSGKIQKTLQPGNTVIRVNSISLKKEPFEGDPVNIILHCEGEDLGSEFEGFMVDKDKPELGVHKGQVGKVRATEYSFKDGEFNGKVKKRNTEILKWLQSFCKVMGKVQWIKDQDDKHDTIEDIVAQLEKDKPYKDIWFNACLAGVAYTNKQGFVNYDLYLPWFTATSVPIEPMGAEPSKLIKFKETYHIREKKGKKADSVEGFEGKKAKGADFDL